MAKTVGVVALQGDFEMHEAAFERCGAEVVLIKMPDQLAGVDRVVIPGGESTTVGKLMDRFGLGAALIEAASAGTPIWGTCMGMILMAKRVADCDQYTLGVLDITVERNAFGSQIHSFEDEISIAGIDDPLTAVFIRSPIVTQFGEGVEVLAEYKGQVVAVRQGARIGTAFHPELTRDDRLHSWFLEV